MTEDEFDLSVDIRNAVVPEPVRLSYEQARTGRSYQRPSPEPLHLMAFVDGVPAGTGTIGQQVYDIDRRGRLQLSVVPEYRRRGAASALYRRLMGYARTAGWEEVGASVYEPNLPLSEGWRQAEGFREIERMRPSELDLTTLDLAAQEPYLERVRREGISLTTLTEDDSEENRRKLWTVYNLAHRDVPHDVVEDEPYDRFQDMLGRPHCLLDSLVIARQGDDYVGFSILAEDTPEIAHTWMTGVHPDHRNRGIAYAVKVESARKAREHGYRSMRTMNHVNNPSMLAVNNRLGYRPLPELVMFLKNLHA